MFIPVEKSKDKATNYKKLLETLPYYINQGDPWYTTLANTSSILDYFMDDVNWIGFYVMHGNELFLGPFQGKAACTKIMMGSGVCGKAAINEQPINVENVDAFEGHITCDSDSKSELVVPLMKDGALFGVLDIDSPVLARFDQLDVETMERIAKIIIDNLS